MSLAGRARSWLTEERERLQKHLSDLEGGVLRVGEKRKKGATWIDVDTTAEAIESCRRKIAELDAILAGVR